jgi:hypothetical protein
MEGEINTRGTEPPFTRKIDQNEFEEIFGITGQSTNYMSWKKIATILEIKEIPSHIDGIKHAIENSIQDMEWKDINETFKLYTIKHSKKKVSSNKKTDESEDFGKRLSRMEELIMNLIGTKQTTKPIHGKQEILPTKPTNKDSIRSKVILRKNDMEEPHKVQGDKSITLEDSATTTDSQETNQTQENQQIIQMDPEIHFFRGRRTFQRKL